MPPLTLDTQPVTEPKVEPTAQPATPQTPPAAEAGQVPALGTPEYTAYMAELGRKARGEVAPTPENQTDNQAKSPIAGVPEKFLKNGELDVDALVKSYNELEKRQSSKPAADAPKADATPAAGAEDEAEVAKTYQAYFDKIQETGELGEEDYKTLTGKFPKYLVDSVMSMARENAELAAYRDEREQAEVLTAIGGRQAYDSMAAWARQNLSTSEQAAFNQQVSAGKESATLALMGLKARFEAVNGRVPQTHISGTPAGISGGDTFRDRSEFLTAMADSRYSSDSAYRQSVYQKLARTRQVNPGFSVS